MALNATVRRIPTTTDDFRSFNILISCPDSQEIKNENTKTYKKKFMITFKKNFSTEQWTQNTNCTLAMRNALKICFKNEISWGEKFEVLKFWGEWLYPSHVVRNLGNVPTTYVRVQMYDVPCRYVYLYLPIESYR